MAEMQDREGPERRQQLGATLGSAVRTMVGTPGVPMLPCEPHVSPPAKRRAFSARAGRRPVKNISAVQMRVSELVGALERQDFTKISSRESTIPEKYHVYNESPICQNTSSVFDGETKRFTTRNYPRVSASDRKQPLQLSHSLFDSLREVDTKYPGYFRSATISEYDACQEELNVWMFVMNECVRQIYMHSKSFALVLDALQDRFSELFRGLLANQRVVEPVVVKRETLSLEGIGNGNTQEQPFDDLFRKLNHIVDHSMLTTVDKATVNASMTRLERDVNCRNLKVDESGTAKREVDRLNARNKELLIENFERKRQNEHDEEKINDLINVTESLRRTLSASEQKIYTLTHSDSTVPVMQGLGSVPVEVMSIWEQISHFCKNILDGDLGRLEMDAYFPKDPTVSFSPPYYLMNKPPGEEQKMHFAVFFTEIKKTFDDKTLFPRLEARIRELLTRTSSIYKDNFVSFKNEQMDIAAQAVRKLDEIRNSEFDSSVILRTVVAQPQFMKIPTKGLVKVYSVHEKMAEIYKYAATHPVEKSVSRTVVGAFGGIDNPELVPFIANIAIGSLKDVDVDLFKQFLMGDIPMHAFLFYSEVRSKCGEFSTHDSRRRMALVNDYFRACGWANIPIAQRRSFEARYVQSHDKFAIFCLALYMYCVDNIVVQIGESCQKDVEYTAKSMLNLSDQELFAAEEFMKALSDKGKITVRELAILLLRRNMEFHGLLSSFASGESEVLMSYENFSNRKNPRRAGSRRKQDKMAETMPASRRSIQVTRVQPALGATGSVKR